jgi:hypothetical protein
MTPKKPTQKAGSGDVHSSIGARGRQYRLHGSYVRNGYRLLENILAEPFRQGDSRQHCLNQEP